MQRAQSWLPAPKWLCRGNHSPKKLKKLQGAKRPAVRDNEEIPLTQHSVPLNAGGGTSQVRNSFTRDGPGQWGGTLPDTYRAVQHEVRFKIANTISHSQCSLTLLNPKFLYSVFLLSNRCFERRRTLMSMVAFGTSAWSQPFI